MHEATSGLANALSPRNANSRSFELGTRNLVASISKAHAVTLFGDGVDPFGHWDEFTVACDPAAPLQPGTAVAVVCSDGARPLFGILTTKNPKRAKKLAVSLLCGDDVVPLRNYFPRHELSAIVCLARHKWYR